MNTKTINSFLTQTYALLSTSLLVFAISIVIGLQFSQLLMNPIVYIALFIIEIALIFAIFHTKSSMILHIFAAITGLTTVPLVSMVLATTSGLSTVALAFFGTAIITGGTSLYALTTKRDFSSIGPFLFWTLIAIVVISIINIFIGNPLLHTAISAIALILFSVYMIYDTQQIVKGAYDTPVEAALSLYINIINIFVHLLSLLKSDE